MNPAAPLGVVLNPGGANVGVFSANASAVYFCLYDEQGEREVSRTLLTRGGTDVHSGFVPGVRAAGDVRRCDQRHQLGIMAGAFAQVAVKVDAWHFQSQSGRDN